MTSRSTTRIHTCACLALACALRGNAPAQNATNPTNPAPPPTTVSVVDTLNSISDLNTRLALADSEAAMGHAASCRRTYSTALASTNLPWSVLSRYAVNCILWGEYRTAEQLCRQQLKNNPQDFQTRLLLIRTLASAQRFTDAEGLCRRELLDRPDNRDLLLLLAEIRSMDRDLTRAASVLSALAQAHPDDPTVLTAWANLLLRLNQPSAAEPLFRKLLNRNASNTTALVGLGLSLRHQDREPEAAPLFATAVETNPRSIAARFHRVDHQSPATGDSLLSPQQWLSQIRRLGRQLAENPQSVITPQQWLSQIRRLGSQLADTSQSMLTPQQLASRLQNLLLPQAAEANLPQDQLANAKPAECTEWGRLYAENGMRANAIECMRMAVQQDPEYLPAQLELAGLLGADRQFDESLRIYQTLQSELPDSTRIRLEHARTLAWAEHYDDSLDLYRTLHEQEPENRTLTREMARVAVWAKKKDLALQCYQTILDQPVDLELARQLETCAYEIDSDTFRNLAAQLRTEFDKDYPYAGYERLTEPQDQTSLDLAPTLKIRLERLLTDCYGLYKMQKVALLEKNEKTLAWNNRFYRALKPCQELVAIEPGNQEAWYDLSQLQFMLGLDDEAVAVTQRLLELDPNHSQAPNVLNRMATVEEPFGELGYRQHHELGRDKLSNITREQFDLGAGSRFAGRATLAAHLNHWIERPGDWPRSYPANGLTLSANSRPSSLSAANGALTLKDYDDDRIEDTTTGFAELQANLRDYAVLSLNATRADELYNHHNLLQGTQSDAWTLRAHSFLTRALECTGSGTRTTYNDDNSAQHYYLNAAYALTDHPRVLKAALFAESRDTRETTSYEPAPTGDTNILHPYWTPQEYQAWGVMAEWRHDCSPVLSMGTERRHYDIRVSLRDDTEENPSVEIRADMNWEWGPGWLAVLDATLVRSREWDAETIRASLRHHF